VFIHGWLFTANKSLWERPKTNPFHIYWQFPKCPTCQINLIVMVYFAIISGLRKHFKTATYYPAECLLIWHPNNWLGAFAPRLPAPLSPFDHLAIKLKTTISLPFLILGSTLTDPQVWLVRWKKLQENQISCCQFGLYYNILERDLKIVGLIFCQTISLIKNNS